MEKIKRDKNRVNISKNRSDDISGGYIIKIDKITGDGDTLNEKIAFMSEYTKDGIKGINKNVHFLYEYPKNRDISDEQKNYIQGYHLTQNIQGVIYGQTYAVEKIILYS